MAITASEQSFSTITRELIATHEDVIALFATKGITVEDENQTFVLIIRKSTDAGDKDQIVGEITSSKSIVLQYKEVTTATEI